MRSYLIINVNLRLGMRYREQMVSFFETPLDKIKHGLMDVLGRDFGSNVNVGFHSFFCTSLSDGKY